MSELTSLLERHRAFWLHQDGGEPLVRRRPRPPRQPFNDVDVTPDMLDVNELTPAVGARNEGERLIQGGLFRTADAFGRIPWMEAIVGCPIHAGADEAMWPRPALGPHYEGLERIVPQDDNPWLRTLLALTSALVQANDGSYLVTHTLMRGPMDILSALLGDVRMGEAFYLEPERIDAVLRRAAEAFVKVARAQHGLIPPFEGGRACWAYGLWAPGTVIRFQSDSASQLSPTMYREQVLPHDRTVMQAFDHSILDLHSGGTLHLYPVLLEVDELSAISITLDPYESAPTLPELLPALRAILERKSLSLAGRISAEQVEWLRRELPTGCLSICA
jgi:hypothetical protein